MVGPLVLLPSVFLQKQQLMLFYITLDLQPNQAENIYYYLLLNVFFYMACTEILDCTYEIGLAVNWLFYRRLETLGLLPLGR